jgi:hypothetical protein
VSGESETMRLIAEVVDKFSGPLKDLNKAIGTVNAAGKRLHDEGAKQTREHAKAYKELHERIDKTKEMVSGTLSPAMAALGLTTFGVGEALGKVVDKLKEVGAQYNIMQDVSRRAGMSVDHVRALSVGFERLGISQESANDAAAEFGEHMDRLKRGNTEELASWTTKLGGAYQALGASLRSIPTREGQLGAVFDFFSSHPNIPIDQKRKFYEEILHLPPELATKTGEELKAALAAGMAWANDHPDNEGLGKGLSAAFSDLREAMAGFQEDMVETFGTPGIAMVKGFASAIKELGKDIKEASPFSGKAPELLNNGVWDKANPMLKWLADPHLPSLQELKDRAYANPDSSKEPPTSKPGTLQWSLPKDPFKGGPLDGYHPAAFTTGGGDPESMLSSGVKTGMLAAFREWFASTGAGGYQKASYSDGGGSTGGAAAAARGWGGGGYTDLSGGGGRGRGAPGGGGPTGVAPSENNDASLTGDGGPLGGFDRSRFSKELASNPALRNKIMRIASNEQGAHPGGTQAVIESMMNRANLRGTSLEREARWHESEGGYYQQGNMGRGALENSKSRAILENSLKNALGGADTIGLATDNSSQGLAEREAATGKFIRHAKIHGESFFHPGWAEPRLRDKWLAMKANRDLLSAAKTSGFAGNGGGEQKVTGDASLGITLNGFPKGTKTDLTYGGLFTSYSLSRGRQMEQSEQK